MSNAFCLYPFVSSYTNLSGDCLFCCYGKKAIQPDEIDSLRTKIYNDEKIDHCSHCYDIEEAGLVSPRIEQNTLWLDTPEISEYIKNWTPGNTKISYYDIRYNNRCNLACIMCDARSSSLIAKEFNIENPKYANTFDDDALINATQIYIAGGEPLITKECLQLLTKIGASDIQPNVIINTNLTRVDTKLLDIFKHLKNLLLVVSVDGYGRVNEYHRHPLNWNVFTENLDKIKDANIAIRFNTVVDAISVINVHKLLSLTDQVDSWKLEIIRSPDVLQLSNVPKHHKDEFSQNVKKLFDTRFNNNDIINKILDDINSKGDPEALAKFIYATDSRKGINHKNYLDISID